MKTAIDNIISKIIQLKSVSPELFIELMPILSEGLAEEKQNIISSHSSGVWDCISGEQYYNETFNNENK